eukprot:514566_1
MTQTFPTNTLKHNGKFRTLPICRFITTNIESTQSIKKLLKTKDSSLSRSSVMKHGFDIYHQINNTLNPSFLISFLKLILHCNYPDKIQLIWTDIQQSINSHSNEKDNISNICCLWLQCCIESNKMDINKCIELLQWSQTFCHQLHIKGYLINKLLSKCGNNKQSLEYINCLIDSNFFIG